MRSHQTLTSLRVVALWAAAVSWAACGGKSDTEDVSPSSGELAIRVESHYWSDATISISRGGTWNRIGLAGGIGYALLVYVAAAAWLEHTPAGWQRRLAIGTVAVVAALWIIRSGEMWFQLRDTAWDYRVEWTDRFEELGAKQEQTDVLRRMKTAALARTPADPRHDPAWTYLLWERRFRRSAEPPYR